ncbi:MAG: aspartate kinase, partial [Thermoanaerobaculia bacterium]
MTDVLKFGGTSVGSAERIRDVAHLVGTRGGDPCLVVVSAAGGVTDLLVELKISSSGRDREAVEAARAVLAQRHGAALDGLGLPAAERDSARTALQAELRRAEELCSGILLLEEVSLRTSDALLAVGELMSSRLVAAALRARGTDAAWIDPREILATDATHGAAQPDEKETALRVSARVVPELEAGRTVVTGGFVGAAPDGSTTTLGRGGSDYSAALFGAALYDAGGAVDRIEIWTDVDGILTADPRVVPAARLVPEVSAAEAAELAFFGAKVLHPATIRPAVARGIPVAVRNSFRPEC